MIGWRIKPKLDGNKQYAEYIRRMADAQRAAHPEIYNAPKPIKPENMTFDEWTLSLQGAETKKLLKLHEDPNYKRDWSAPLPDNVQVMKDGEVFINERAVSPEEADHWYSTRPRNTLGQSEQSAFTEERREIAAHALIVSPPARLTKEEMDLVSNIEPPPEGVPASLPEPEKKEGWSIWELMNWGKK